MDRYQFLNDNLDRQLAWISKSDKRLSFVVPIALAMLASLAAKAPELEDWTATIWTFVGLASIALSITLIYCLCATFPRTDAKKNSNIYFEGILSKEIDQFAQEAVSLDDVAIQEDLAFQIHINAEIASTKYKLIQKALFTLFLSSFLWVIALYILWSV